MTLWEALGLGVLQGATEFLPVSSSGHLVIGQALLNLRIPGVQFEIVLHLATLLSVVVVYRTRILRLARGAALERRPADLRYVGLVLVATIPAGAVGVLVGDAVTPLFDNPHVTGFALLVTGALLFSTRWALRKPSSPNFGARTAVLVGFAQALALIPGISRSGATVVTALWLGVAPLEAAAFSFLMSIPVIAGAGILQIPDLLGQRPEELSPGGAIAAAVVAAATGIVAIRFFIAMLGNRAFPAFAWYCWSVGLLFLGWLSLP